jgi:hypothetical protein
MLSWYILVDKVDDLGELLLRSYGEVDVDVNPRGLCLRRHRSQ